MRVDDPSALLHSPRAAGQRRWPPGLLRGASGEGDEVAARTRQHHCVSFFIPQPVELRVSTTGLGFRARSKEQRGSQAPHVSHPTPHPPLTLQVLLPVAPPLCSRASGTGTRSSGHCR